MSRMSRSKLSLLAMKIASSPSLATAVVNPLALKPFTKKEEQKFNIETLKMALLQRAPKSVVGQFTMTTTS